MRNEQRKKRPATVLFAACLSCLLTASPLSRTASAADAAPADTGGPQSYLIGSGDLLQIVVWKNPDLTGEYRVRPDGKFSMPLIGDVVASGKASDAISMQVEQKLKLFIESPYVSVIVTEAASNKIYVLGEVVHPGSFPIEGTLTVLQAIALAGGFAEFSKRDEMVVVRGSGEAETKFFLSYREILRSTDKKSNLILQRGDTLVVY